MKLPANKYFILAVAGAIIIAAGLYLLLDNYFEKVEIIVAARALPENTVIERQDISKMQYFKNSLPKGYITDEDMVIGRVLAVSRQPADPVTEAVFTAGPGQNIADSLKENEVMLALNIDSSEPIYKKLLQGSRISIVSSQKDKDLESFTSRSSESLMEIAEGSFIERSVFKLSKNIIAVDGQVVIKNLEIINLEKSFNPAAKGFAGNPAESLSVFIKCDIKEAPFITRLIKDNNYKIVLEKS
ncbi:MAG: hypothetical protein FJW68_02830 [Actinobacteria bacterium]|nr:hypothetical protein [Actinomycetota bacterium]